jgi:hypothetical protein
MDMKKWQRISAGFAALCAAGIADAAVLGNLSGQSCGAQSGTWHFVNNQAPGAPTGTLNATWSTGETCSVLASKVLGSTQHFYCTASGTLTGASTNLPGKLVLSDFSCEDIKTPPPPPPPPPPCDPKTDPKCV